MAARRTALQDRYQGNLTEARPYFVDETGWEMFRAHVREGRTLVQIARDHQLPEFKVREIVWRVDRDLQLPRPDDLGPNEVTGDSPLEDLNLSTRARNALREMGFDTVRSLLERDFTLAGRRLGRVGKEEIVCALAARGFHPPSRPAPAPDFDVEKLMQHIAMLHAHIERSHRRWLRRVQRIERQVRAMIGA